MIKAALNKDSETLLVVPFVGSGSECVAAKKNNVRFIGFEINNDYIVIANKRLQENEEEKENEEENENESKNDIEETNKEINNN